MPKPLSAWATLRKGSELTKRLWVYKWTPSLKKSRDYKNSCVCSETRKPRGLQTIGGLEVGVLSYHHYGSPTSDYVRGQVTREGMAR